MKHQWVGDSADFGKHGLLRALCKPSPKHPQPLRLGVVWYLTPDGGEKPRNDPHAYLKLPDDEADFYRRSDPDLYDALRGFCDAGPPDVGEVERSGIHPQGTVFYSEYVPEKLGKETVARRREWAETAAAEMEPCDLVFLDPDNGLEPNPYKKRGSPKAPHVRLYEIWSYFAREQSVVFYQTSTMNGNVIRQVYEKRQLLRAEFGVETLAMVYARHKDGWVVFLVIPAERHQERLKVRLRGMVDNGWEQHIWTRGTEAREGRERR